MSKKFDAVARANADAALINAKHTEMYAGSTAIIRESVKLALPLGSVVMLSYCETLHAGVKGWAPMTMKSQISAWTRVAKGCADATVQAAVAKELDAGVAVADVIKNAKVPSFNTQGRKGKKDGETAVAVSKDAAIIAAFKSCDGDTQATVLTACFNEYLLKVKKPETRLAIQGAIDAIKAA